MYAIIQDGGRQFRVEQGAEIEFDRKSLKPGAKIEFGDVLVCHDGEKVKVGAPTVKDAKVLGEVVEEIKGDKIRVYKYRRRKGYRRSKGHRQKYTLIRITDIITK